MKKLNRCFYILVAILNLTFLSALTEATEANVVEIKPVYIDVRSGPGRGYPVFHALERNEEVVVLKSRTDWVKVETLNRYEPVSGWVHRSEIFKNDASALNHSRWYWAGSMGDFNGAQSLDASFGYRLTNYLSVEANYGQATGDFSDIEYAYLRLNSAFRTFWRITPYFSIGAGQLTTTPNTKLVQSDQRSDSSMLAGFGIRSYLTRNFYMRFEYNQHLVLTNRESNEDVDQWLFGLTVNF